MRIPHNSLSQTSQSHSCMTTSNGTPTPTSTSTPIPTFSTIATGTSTAATMSTTATATTATTTTTAMPFTVEHFVRKLARHVNFLVFVHDVQSTLHMSSHFVIPVVSAPRMNRVQLLAQFLQLRGQGQVHGSAARLLELQNQLGATQCLTRILDPLDLCGEPRHRNAPAGERVCFFFFRSAVLDWRASGQMYKTGESG